MGEHGQVELVGLDVALDSPSGQVDPVMGTYVGELLDVFAPPKLKKDAGKVKRAPKQVDPVTEWVMRKLPMQFDWIPQQKEQRARKRVAGSEIIELEPGQFRVSACPGMSDSYDKYLVKRKDGRWTCSCQGHAYGDTRTLCTHAIAVMLKTYERDKAEFVGLVDRADSPFHPDPPKEKFTPRDEWKIGKDSFTVPKQPYVEPDNSSGQPIPVPIQITDELINLVEQANSKGEVFVIDEWEIQIPRAWQIRWDTVGLGSAASVSTEIRQDQGRSIRPAASLLQPPTADPRTPGQPEFGQGQDWDRSGIREDQSGRGIHREHGQAVHGGEGYFPNSETRPTRAIQPGHSAGPVSFVEDAESVEDFNRPHFSPSESEENERDLAHRQRAIQRLSAIVSKPPTSHWQLPGHFTDLRDHQWTALQQIIGAWAAGRKFVFVDAPTGAGKSIIANIAFLEWSGIPYGEEAAKGFVVVTSKDLQDQMHGDFHAQWWFAMIKGRLNYPTANFPERFLRGKVKDGMEDLGEVSEGAERVAQEDWASHIDCSDCEYAAKKHCRYCDPPGVTGPPDEGQRAPCLFRCPYRIQLRKVVDRPFGLLNTAYLLRSCNSNAWGQFSDRSVCVIDECDTLEGVMMGYVTVEVPEKRLFVLGSTVGRPEYKTFGTEAVADWFGWAGRALLRCNEIIGRRELQIKGEIEVGGPDGIGFGEDKIRVTSDQRDLRRDQKYWEGLAGNLQILTESLTKNEPWVYDGYETNKETKLDEGPVVFKPVKIDKFTEPKLFKNFKQVCLLSATTISFDQLASDLGIPAGDFAGISIPRTFDPKRSPIYALPVADNSKNKHVESWPWLLKATERILEANTEHRVMIHAVSYVQAEKLYRHLKSKYPGRAILSHTRDSGSKKFALQKYKASPGAVLISPSMARGADFKGDLCRVQIILKVPFPYLGDKQIKARLYSTHDGKRWYAVQTIRELVQMTGRNVRSEEDWGENWILDSQFLRVFNENPYLFPDWWRASLIMCRPEDFWADLRKN